MYYTRTKTHKGYIFLSVTFLDRGFAAASPFLGFRCDESFSRPVWRFLLLVSLFFTLGFFDVSFAVDFFAATDLILVGFGFLGLVALTVFFFVFCNASFLCLFFGVRFRCGYFLRLAFLGYHSLLLSYYSFLVFFI